MAALQIIRLSDQPSIPWANGGGLTRDLLRWPAAPDWSLRVSVAQIDRTGPFSHLPGYERWFAVIDGAGVELSFAEGGRQLRLGDAPLCFDGAKAPGCRLLEGPTLDLNLMLRQLSGRGRLWQAALDQAWTEAVAWRAVYVAQPLILTVGDGSPHALPAHSLAFSEDAAGAVWQLQRGQASTPPSDQPRPAAWCMTFDPHPDSTQTA